MSKTRESELLGQIEVLEGRIEELLLQNQFLRESSGTPGVLDVGYSRRMQPGSYLKNYLAAVSFPVLARLFGAIYRRVYGLKK